MTAIRLKMLLCLLVPLCITACGGDDAILAQAAQLGKLSTDTRSTVNTLASDVYQSCLRITALSKRTQAISAKKLMTPGDANNAMGQKECAQRKTLSDAINRDASPIFDYLDAVAALGNYKPPTIDTSKAFTALGVSQSASSDYSTLAQAINNFVTSGWRVSALRNQVPTLNAAFQGAIADLASVFNECSSQGVPTYPGILNSEDQATADSYSFILANLGMTATPAVAGSNPPACAQQTSPAPAASPVGTLILPRLNPPVPENTTSTNKHQNRTTSQMKPGAVPRAPDAFVALVTFDHYNAELASDYIFTEKQRESAGLLVKSLEDIAVANQALANLLLGERPPCPKPASPSSSSPSPAPSCSPFTYFASRAQSSSVIAQSLRDGLAAITRAKKMLAKGDSR